MKSLIQYCLKELKINLTKEQVDQFKLYQQELLKWNQKFNLTSITEPRQVEIKHFIDSVSCLKFIDSSKSFEIIDIGSGAGFPGIPIKIIYPNINIRLIDATQKKVDFCKHILKILNFDPNAVIAGRAEELAQSVEYRENFDIAISRAVANLPVLLELMLPFVRIGGSAIAMKGKNIQQELASTEKALEVLGGKIENITQEFLPILNEERNLITIRKVNPTPGKYPRRSGVPLKKPLV
jgi:16S rRNA (guanine527-N7)-methyltransferase